MTLIALATIHYKHRDYLPDLIVKPKGTDRIHRLKPGDQLKFTLQGFKVISEWTLTYEQLREYVGVKHAVLEVTEDYEI